MLRFVLSVTLAAACLVPNLATAQSWSPEEQELVDHLHAVWDAIEENDEATYDLWRDTVNPSEDMVWWFTDQGAPYDLKALQKWHQWWGTREGKYTFMNVRPIKVRIVDSVGMVWFWALGEWVDKEGERHEWQDQRLEIFHRVPGGWEFVGGMVTPVVPFEGN